MSSSTVSAVLLRIGLGRLSRLEPPEPANRYERRHAGELVHIDVKKLGRIKDGAGKRFVGDGRRRTHNFQRVADAAGVRRLAVGWEYVHVCVDDATRLAYVEVLEDEKATTAAGFLRRAIAHFAAYGIRIAGFAVLQARRRTAHRQAAALRASEVVRVVLLWA
jgi:hypothetical protein